MTKKLHYFSGLTIALFVGVHLTNHLMLLGGTEAHLSFMEIARTVYRNRFVELLLLLAVFLQILSGIQLLRSKRKDLNTIYDKLHLYSGLYLSFFLLIHVGAVLSGRLYAGIDTNLYFGAAGLNTFPHLLFFVPYYSLSVIAFFTHVACIHRVKMMRFSNQPVAVNFQTKVIMWIGGIIALVILIGMMQVEIPSEYQL
ncbi:hypothetical protein AAG747_24385 [Rapidithrix thailandica]|uniref:Uncharacterized protein n=1 Tax=Rapidithrix thailandica TaxID=413964 RepID=A0AAW9S1P0_9BACT